MKVNGVLFTQNRVLQNFVFPNRKWLHVHAFGVAREIKTVGKKLAFEKMEFLNSVKSAEETA